MSLGNPVLESNIEMKHCTVFDNLIDKKQLLVNDSTSFFIMLRA